MPDPIDPEVIRAMRRFKRLLDEREAATMLEMVQRWAQLERALTDQLELLAAEIAAKRAAGQVVTADAVRLTKRYAALQQQVRDQIAQYADYAAQRITREQEWMAQAGIDHSAEMLRATLARGGAGAFDVLPVEALQRMAGYVADGSPLRAYFAKMYPEAVQGIMDALFTGMARGWAPGKIAKYMRDALGVAPRTAILSARTETLRVYREASLEQYRKSGLVDGYFRVASKSVRTCMACLAMDGQWFPLTESFAEHPAGRCRPVPAKQGQTYPGTQGLDWFRKQPEERQRLMLGKGRYEAWKANKFDLTDIAKLHKDPTWGSAWQERSLKDLLTLPKRPAGVPPSAPGGIDVGKLELGKFATLEEAQAWGRAHYPHIDWDFKGAHIDAINPTMVQFDKLAQEFPEVAKRLEYIGTRQVKRPFYWNEQSLAHAVEGKIIGLNPRHYGNPDELRAALNLAVESRYLPRGCDTIESVLTHEFGHHVKTWLETSDLAFIPYVRDDGFGLVRQAVKDFSEHTTARQRKILGNRAAVSPNEAWALAFSSRYHTPGRAQGVLVQNMAKLLDTLMSRRWMSRLDIDPSEISAQEIAVIYAILERIGAVPL